MATTDDTTTADLGEDVVKDYDETRRLLYMALVASRTKRYNLVGTLVNALRHHQGLRMTPGPLVDEVIRAVDGQNNVWIWEQIDKITARLGEA